MNYVKNNIENVKEWLESLSNEDLVNIHNIYCNVAEYSDDQIYNNDDEFFDMFFENEPLKAVQAAQCGSYDVGDDWVMFNGYANLVSFSNPSAHIDIEDIAQCILDNEREFKNYVSLEEEEEEEDEDE